MEQRMANPGAVLGAIEQLQALAAVPHGHGVPEATLELVHLRTSQINGCAWCLDAGVRKNTPRSRTRCDFMGRHRSP